MAWAGLLVVVMAAAAEPRVLTLGVGDCRSAPLLEATTTVSSAAAKRSNNAANERIERFRPVPVATAEDLERQLEEGQAHFYSGSHEKALQALRRSSLAIEQLPPGDAAWKLASRALILQSLVHKAAGRKADAFEAQQRVLRVAPAFMLDADYYSPATIQAFELARQQVLKAKKVKLTLQSVPEGSEVFVDGARQGRTPFSGSFPAGEYRVTLLEGQRASFTRSVVLTKDATLAIDVAFESTLNLARPLCVADDATALKLARLAAIEHVALVSLEAPMATVALLEVSSGATTRRHRIPLSALTRDELVVALVDFLLTGRPSASELALLVTVPEVLAFPATAPAATSEVAVAQPSPAPALAVDNVSLRGNTARLLSLVMMGAGVAAAGVGGAVYALGGSDRASLRSMIDELGRVKPGIRPTDVTAAQQRVDATSQSAIALAASGGALLVGGIAVFFLLPPAEGSARLAVAPMSDGLWAGATFSF